MQLRVYCENKKYSDIKYGWGIQVGKETGRQKETKKETDRTCERETVKDKGSVREAESHTEAVWGCEKELERKTEKETEVGIIIV